MATDTEVLMAARQFDEAAELLANLRAQKVALQSQVDALQTQITAAKAARDSASANLKTLAASL